MTCKMKQIEIFGIVFLICTSFFISNAFAATLEGKATTEALEKIDKSKYLAQALTIHRNANGDIIGATQIDASRYLNHPMLDKYLDFLPTVKTGIMNQKQVELKQLSWTTEFNDCFQKITCQDYMYSFVTILGMSYEDKSYEVFRGLNHGHIVKVGDSATSYWSVFRILN